MKPYSELVIKDKKDKVLLVGCGPSIDLLANDIIKRIEKEYDICTITDAIKIFNKPTYSFNYHIAFMTRMFNDIKKAKYFFTNQKTIDNLIKQMDNKKSSIKYIINKIKFNIFLNMNNVYVFAGINPNGKNLLSGLYDSSIKDIPDGVGSVVGATYFLIEQMGYKHIEYIGFDGGTQYGKKTNHFRKYKKVLAASKNYKKFWDMTTEYVKRFEDVKFIKYEVDNG